MTAAGTDDGNCCPVNAAAGYWCRLLKATAVVADVVYCCRYS